MSDQLTSQSRPSSGISRRTALRGAAWSASAVTVVVATPNIAAASPGQTPKGEAKGSVTRSGNNGAVFTFDTKFKNTGTTAIKSPGQIPHLAISTPKVWGFKGLTRWISKPASRARI